MLLKDQMEIDEWEGIALEIMQSRAAYKMPLPAVFLAKLGKYQREHPVPGRKQAFKVEV